MSSFHSFRATATAWALLQTPSFLLRLPSGNESQVFTDECCETLAFSAELSAEVPLTTASFRIHSQPSSVSFGEKKLKELIAICNYDLLWQHPQFNGARISELPLLRFSQQPMLPSSCQEKVPIALHSRQRQLPSGL